jgi:hypothetical protein
MMKLSKTTFVLKKKKTDSYLDKELTNFKKKATKYKHCYTLERQQQNSKYFKLSQKFQH